MVNSYLYSIGINGRTADEIRPIFGISNNLDDPKEKERVRAENEWAAQSRHHYEERMNTTND